MESKNISLYYWNSSYFEKDKEEIKYNLNFIEEEAKKLFPGIISVVDSHVFIDNFEKSRKNMGDVLKYFLSKDRSYHPVVISCSEKKDYEGVEKILQENFGEDAKLLNGTRGQHFLFG